MVFLKKQKIKSLTKKLKSLQKNRLHNQPSEVELARETNLYMQLLAIYNSVIGHKKFPYAQQMARECLRAAAALEDANAQYLLGKSLLDEARFREQLQQEEVFASTVNEKCYTQLYEEAHAYLKAAQALNHIEAKRLLGLCYINGWGMAVEKERGFDLIMSSIEQEGSWDKVPQIFEALGLNKPEFFEALVKHRNKKNE